MTRTSRVDRTEPPAAEDVAIVIPSYDRPRQLRACLEHLARCDGGPWRTIVVDDGSPEPLSSVCDGLGDWVSVLRQPNGGPGAARNTGAVAAEGARWLLFTDDDCLARPDWVLRLVAAQAGTKQRLVGGHVANALTGNVYAQASQSVVSFLYDFYQTQGSDMSFFATNNMCCLRDDFLSIGGFDPSFRTASEDRDMSLRWKDAGGTLAYAPDAVTDHVHDLDLRSFWNQHRNYGRGARRLHRALDGRADRRSKIEPFGFYMGLLLYPLRHSRRMRLYESFLIGLSQVAMIAGYRMPPQDERD